MSHVALETAAQLAFFAALFAGALLGWGVGSLTRFELGLGVGLVLPGAVAAWFAWQLLQEFRIFTAPESGVRHGRVIAVEDVPVSGGTQPEPIIEFVDAAGTRQQIRGPRSGGYEVQDRVSVLPARGLLEPARVGRPRQLRGAAIAMLLFATFPLTVGSWFLADGLGDRHPVPVPSRRTIRPRVPVAKTSSAALAHRRRVWRDLNRLLFLTMFAAILWIGYGTGELANRFTLGFGTVALALFGYAGLALSDRSGSRQHAFGFVVLGVNFGVWALALRLLVDQSLAW